MSTIPSRTRSLRKPTDTNSSRYGRTSAAEGGLDSADTTLEKPVTRSTRSGQSPSRLPVKPTTRSTSTISSARPPSAADSINSNASMRPPPPRANISKPTTSAGGLQRSASTRRPSNADSTSSGLQRSTSIRRPSDASTTSSTVDPVKQDRSRPPITQYKHLRNASTSSNISSTSSLRSGPPTQGHTRNKSSTSSFLPNPTSTRPPSRDASNIRPPSRDSSNTNTTLENPQLRKNTFSTYQQHFSPAKSLAPKPHPAAFLAPPSPSKLPSNIAISAETAKLQNELLQLHLLHKDSVAVKEQWKDSAKRKLGVRFQGVVNKHERLVQLEGEEMGKANALALKRWVDKGTPGLSVEERARILDEVLSGVWGLGEQSGKYARLVRRFEKWLAGVEQILKEREGEEESGSTAEDVYFVEEIEQPWKDECFHIQRKLEAWDSDLESLGVPDGGSLKAVVEQCGAMVSGMLEELSSMTQIEEDVVCREKEWIKSMNDDTLSDDEIDKPVAGAIWRSR